MKTQFQVLGTDIKFKDDDFISLTDIVKYKGDKSDVLIQSWMRNRKIGCCYEDGKKSAKNFH